MVKVKMNKKILCTLWFLLFFLEGNAQSYILEFNIGKGHTHSVYSFLLAENPTEANDTLTIGDKVYSVHFIGIDAWASTSLGCCEFGNPYTGSLFYTSGLKNFDEQDFLASFTKNEKDSLKQLYSEAYVFDKYIKLSFKKRKYVKIYKMDLDFCECKRSSVRRPFPTPEDKVVFLKRIKALYKITKTEKSIFKKMYNQIVAKVFVRDEFLRRVFFAE